MGLSTTKTKTTSDQRTTEDATTTPTVAPWLDQSTRGLNERIDTFATTPYVVPGASDLQQRAFGAAGNLGSWQNGLDASRQTAQSVANAPANLSANVQLGNASSYAAPTLGAVSTTAPQGYAASNARSQGYDAASADAVRLAALQQGQATTARAAQLLDIGLDPYLNPATRALVDTTLTDFDVDANRQRAAQAAAGARNKALAGSRYAFQSAATEGEHARARAAADAAVRDRAFTQAVGMAQYDSGNRQAAAQANADRLTSMSATNAQMGNQRNQAQGTLDMQRNLANQEARNQAAALAANAANQASLFNAGAANEAAAFGASAANQANLFNAGQQNQAAQTQAQLQAQAAAQNAAAQNQFALQQGTMTLQNNQFNAGQQDAARSGALQAAGLGLNIANSQAANQLADINLLGSLGGEQRNIENQQALARLAQLQAEAQLRSTFPYNAYTSQNVSSSGTSRGSSTQTQTPSLANMLLAGASMLPLPFPR